MLVVNPNNRLRTPMAAVEPPLWAGLIAGYEATIGSDVDILDAEGLDLTFDQTVEAIKQSRFNHVVIVVMGNNPSVSSTPKMPIAEALADRIAPFKDISMTGIHPIAAGSRYPVMHEAFQGTPDIPWDKLPMHVYRAHNWHCLDGSPRSPYGVIYTSLGCPYDCYYCNIHALYEDRKVRFRPIENIIREAETLATRYRVKNIKIWDELFTLKEDRVIEICEGLAEFEFNIWAYARLDTVTGKMLTAMKRGGINWLAYGFESVTDPKFIDRAEDVIKMTRDAGINIIANFMFGLPGTTRDDDERSLWFAKKHLFEYVNFYDAKPYPGSKWYEEIMDILGVPPGWGWYNQYRNISPFRQMAFTEYFTNPDYLAMIERKWGFQAVDRIQEMMGCPIK